MGDSSAAIGPALSLGLSQGMWGRAGLCECDPGGPEQTIPLTCISARNQSRMQLSVKIKRKLNIGSIEANRKITNLEFWPLSVIMWPKKKFLRIKDCGCSPCHR